jgi:Uma2 family endonuclease
MTLSSQPAAPRTVGVPENGAAAYELDPDVFPNLDELITEDGAAVDNIHTEKQLRLLTEALYSSWRDPNGGRPFLVLADVGWFFKKGQPPLVPDILLSLDVEPAGSLRSKEGRSYFQWLIGKSPEVIIEIVSDAQGGEDGLKMRHYAQQRVTFYVIYDPDNMLKGGVLRAFVLHGRHYERMEAGWLAEVGLGLRLWTGTFEGVELTWLRWCDKEGKVIPIGAEQAEKERQRAERLAAQLRALGAEPEV